MVNYHLIPGVLGEHVLPKIDPPPQDGWNLELPSLSVAGDLRPEPKISADTGIRVRPPPFSTESGNRERYRNDPLDLHRILKTNPLDSLSLR